MSKNLKIYADVIEQEAIDQIELLMEQPAFADCKVRIMPDVHAGAGCVIGFTADLGEKVIPNVVGVDIGCGMLTTQVTGEMDFKKLDAVIREKIPSGMTVRDHVLHAFDLDGLRCRKHLRGGDYFERSIGTLGGGNHFIEVDVDDDGNHYLVIHSGSRNLGKQVAEYYQKLAIENEYGSYKEFNKERNQTIHELKEQGREKEIQDALAALKQKWNNKLLDGKIRIPRQLCYLTGKDREDYLHDMAICQRYAKINRYEMSLIIIYEMGWILKDEFETVHNYIDMESNIVRKGAVSARKGEKLLIPLNMRDGSMICVGKGNDDWNQSAPHGAGRLMSRHEARARLSVDDYRETMSGIFTTSVGVDTIDEAPEAYKPVSAIAPLIGDTVEIQKIIRPVYNFKAGE